MMINKTRPVVGPIRSLAVVLGAASFLHAIPGPAVAADPDAVAARRGLRLSREHRQVLLVVAPSWTSSRASLERFEAELGAWRAVGERIAVRLGSAGLGRGRGLHVEEAAGLLEGPAKREGDKRSPAGIFVLGTAFGRSPRRPVEGSWPWRVATPLDFWVDDPRSTLYNTWQTLPDPKSPRPWRSAEALHRYRLAIVIAHNLSPVRKGEGSAVFLHSAASLDRPSVGCTVLLERDLEVVLAWLKPERSPVLVQLPR
jgi:hypothetical protein